MARVRTPIHPRWVFTLYDAPGKHPFVHALNTGGFALCIDLPSHGRNINDLALAWKLRATAKTVSVTNDTLGQTWRFDIGATSPRPA